MTAGTSAACTKSMIALLVERGDLTWEKVGEIALHAATMKRLHTPFDGPGETRWRRC